MAIFGIHFGFRGCNYIYIYIYITRMDFSASMAPFFQKKLSGSGPEPVEHLNPFRQLQAK